MDRLGDWASLQFYDFVAGGSAGEDFDLGFGDVEVFGEEVNESGVGFAVVGFLAEIDGIFRDGV